MSQGSVKRGTDVALPVPIADGGTNATTASDARTNLGLAIGTDVQAYDAGLQDISGLAVTDGNLIVGDGVNWVAESGATARTSLGLGSIATQDASSVSITGGSVTGITDITVADGGTGRSTATAYAVVTGGTTATSPLQSIASVGTSGQVLTSNGAGALPTFQAAAGGGLSSLQNTPEWFDDFISGRTGTGSIGSLCWCSTGSGGTLTVGTPTDRPGIYNFSTGATTTGRIAIHADSDLESFLFGLGEVTANFYIRINALSDATDTFKVTAGFYDVGTMATSGEGIYFTYTHSVNSGNWTLNTSDAGGSNTTADSTVAADTNWVKLGFICNAAASSVTFYIDDVSVGTITTTIPNTSDPTTPFFGILKSAGNGPRSIDVDAFYAKLTLTSAR